MLKSRGFSLVELMISVVIMSVLLALAVPAFNTYVENTRLRSTADVFLTTLESAKATAATQNTQIEVLLTNNNTEASLITAESSTTGAGWMMRTSDRARFLEGRSLIEGGRGGQATVVVTGNVGAVTFTPLGGTTLTTLASFAFTNPTGGTCVTAIPPGPIRCLNVQVTTTGRIKLCDPAAISPDTRACN